MGRIDQLATRHPWDFIPRVFSYRRFIGLELLRWPNSGRLESRRKNDVGTGCYGFLPWRLRPAIVGSENRSIGTAGERRANAFRQSREADVTFSNEALRLTIPTTSPRSLSRGPPELPGLTGAEAAAHTGARAKVGLNQHHTSRTAVEDLRRAVTPWGADPAWEAPAKHVRGRRPTPILRRFLVAPNASPQPGKSECQPPRDRRLASSGSTRNRQRTCPARADGAPVRQGAVHGLLALPQ